MIMRCHSETRREHTVRIHLLSDIHLEHQDYSPAITDADIVILAGDIAEKDRGVRWANDRFRCQVIYVPGNHESYGGHLDTTLEKMRKVAAPHVHVMDCDQVVLAGVRFLGMTMWTDFAATCNVHQASVVAEAAMQDFKAIRTERYRKIRPTDLSRRSLDARRWLEAALAVPFDGPTVVVTHHAPSLRSLQGSPHAGGLLDAAFANAWDDLVSKPVDLWVHGHTHVPVDYLMNGTRVVSNPLGYPGEIPDFDPQLILQLSTAVKEHQ